jgi:hypothetical protein
MIKGPQKPKPIKRDEYKRLPIPRLPFSEPLTPGLRDKHHKKLVDAIGFRIDPILEENE